MADPIAIIPTFSHEPIHTLRPTLRRALQECSSRGLIASTKWIAELLDSLPSSSAVPPPPPHPATAAAGPSYRTSTPVKHPHFSSVRHSLPGLPPVASIAHHRDSLGSVLLDGSSPHRGSDGMEADIDGDEGEDEERRLDEEEQDRYELALALFRGHEMLRCWHKLEGCKGRKARWLRVYSKYLAGDKKAREENGELLGAKDKNAANPYADELLDEVDSWGIELVENDGWFLYLKALLVLALPPLHPSPFPTRAGTFQSRASTAKSSTGLDVRLVALDLLVASVKLEPYNWSAWLKLCACLDGPDELETMLKFLPPVFPTMFFYIHATLEIHAATDQLQETVDELQVIFGDSVPLKSLRGLINYHIREFDDASKFFTAVHDVDPYRVDDLDILSNILYVSEKRAELGMLAHEYTKVDRSRPEVCCLIGNYYSLRREHEKAIVYFKRALKLDRSYLSAWTLMGHEYVEIKNTNAAIASYRRAVDVNRKDYRAWYGLGQTYELLGEPFYALSYYQKATALRPYDARMWSALATCYEKLKRIPDAIQAYLRALISSEPGDNDIALRIGKLYDLSGNSIKAQQYHKRALLEGLKTDAAKSELAKIWLYLSRWEVERSRSGYEPDWKVAEEYAKEAEKVTEFKEEATRLLMEIAKLQV